MVGGKTNRITFAAIVIVSLLILHAGIALCDQRGYSQEVKDHCLTLYCNGMGFRGIERSTGVCHNTVINWVREVSSRIPDENYEIPETAQLDELQTFVGSKKTKFGFGQQ